MRKITAASILSATALLCSLPVTEMFAGETKNNVTNREAFTGKVMREKVRLRLQPSTESPIVVELRKNDLIIVTGETDDFYIVQAPSIIKGYVYRPYILDGVVEGDRVNVRLAPHLEAPIIAQLNSGDKVEGNLSSQNNKWLEIAPPKSTRFYVASDYIEKVGDSSYMARQESRQQEVNAILSNTYFLSQSEMQKPFPEIDSEMILGNYRSVVEEYKDFPEQVTRAKEAIAKFQDEYLHKKIAYLEAKTSTADQERANLIRTTNEKLARQNPRPEPIHYNNPNDPYEKWIREHHAQEISAKMLAWASVELGYYENWAAHNNNRSIQDFYDDQQKQAVSLRGMLEPYDRTVRNKPGDFMLVNRANHLPIAYLYSTSVNLQDKIGQEITVEAVLRPNRNFAYPAYFVLSVQ